MTTPWIIIRIVLALAAIFSIGMWVGRITAPQMGEEVVIPEVEAMDEQTLRYATQRAMRRYRTELELTQEQMKTIRPMFVTVSRRMAMLPPNSKARLAVIEDFHDEIAPHLSDEQKANLKTILEGATSRERE